MKRLLLIVSILLLVVSCGNRNSKNESTQDKVTHESVSDYASPATKSTDEWDAALDEYEKYVDSYLKFYKKAMAGDANAMTEYADYLQRTQKLTEKFSAVEKELTPKQYSRFMELQTKMVTGLSDM